MTDRQTDRRDDRPDPTALKSVLLLVALYKDHQRRLLTDGQTDRQTDREADTNTGRELLTDSKQKVNID